MPRQHIEGEVIARLFHENYERLAPEFGYKTREDSAVPWEDVPEQNKKLMIATAEAVIAQMPKADETWYEYVCIQAKKAGLPKPTMEQVNVILWEHTGFPGFGTVEEIKEQVRGFFGVGDDDDSSADITGD